MCKPNILTQQIPSLNNELTRLSIIGVGHPLFGDDYIGCWVTDRLKEQFSQSEKLQIISAESKPENIIGPIIRFQPDHVLLLDAVSGADPGSIVIIPWEKELLLDTYLFSAPLSKFCTFIHNETGCAIILIGIQIPFSDMSLEVSEPIQQTGRFIVECFQQILNESAEK